MQVLGPAIEARMSGRRRHLAGVRNAAGTGPEVLSVSLHQKKMLWLASPFLLLTILLLIHFTYHRSISWFCDARSASDSDSRPYKYFPQGHRHSQSRRRNRTRQTRSPLSPTQPFRSFPQTRADKTRQVKSRQDERARIFSPHRGSSFRRSFRILPPTDGTNAADGKG